MNLLHAAATVVSVLLVTLSATAPFDTHFAAAQDRHKQKADYPVQPVPFTAVRLTTCSGLAESTRVPRRPA